MRISSNFNRLIHGVILKEVSQIRALKVRDLRVSFRPFYLSLATLKELLKYLDSDYPRDINGVPLSYKRLNCEDFISHIAFIEQLCADNGYILDYTKGK